MHGASNPSRGGNSRLIRILSDAQNKASPENKSQRKFTLFYKHPITGAESELTFCGYYGDEAGISEFAYKLIELIKQGRFDGLHPEIRRFILAVNSSDALDNTILAEVRFGRFESLMVGGFKHKAQTRARKDLDRILGALLAQYPGHEQQIMIAHSKAIRYQDELLEAISNGEEQSNDA
jgi:hypothetical protein